MSDSATATPERSRSTAAAPRVRETGVDEEALARCEHLVQTGRPFGLVTGPAGVGKSLLLRRLAAASVTAADPPPILLDVTQADGETLLADLSDALAAGGPGQSAAERWRSVRDRLEGLVACGRRQLVLLDHLDAADPSACAVVARLLQSGGEASGLTIIAAARHPAAPAIAELQQDFGWLRIELAPLSHGQTRDALRRRLRQSGRHEHALDSAAVSDVLELTRGNPRQVERLVELALLAAEADAAETVSAPLLRAAARELCGATP